MKGSRELDSSSTHTEITTLKE